MILKGADGLYASKQYLLQALATLSPELRTLVVAKTLYDGSTLSMNQMAEFYLAADVYVSPYRAEGFNLPVLEASASGIPVICTKGGQPVILSTTHPLYLSTVNESQKLRAACISNPFSII